MKPGVSFVVPAHNEERYLEATLDAIHASARAAGVSYEIVVADDASTDATARIAADHGARVVHVNLRHIAAVRNAGARSALASRLFFVDADTQLNEAVLRGAMAALDAGAVAGGAGVRLPATSPAWARFFTAIVVRFMQVARLAAGCFVFSTREAFEAAGGFDERYFASEEWVLSQALKRHGRFVVLREAVLTSDRKVQSRSGAEVFRITLLLALRGPKGLRDRRNCDFWYADRR
jgi:glycosyltransferase involved in cell wall biosynthesis